MNIRASPTERSKETFWRATNTSARRILAHMDLKQFFLKQKETIRTRTRQVVGMIRPEQMDWRPEKDALTIGETLRHLWVSEEGVRRTALDGNFSYYEKRVPQGLRAVLGTPRTLEDEIADLERVHRETLAAAEQFPLERWDDDRVHEGLGYRHKVSVILMNINAHEVHHRAQLMTYLRILGSPVPEAIPGRQR